MSKLLPLLFALCLLFGCSKKDDIRPNVTVRYIVNCSTGQPYNVSVIDSAGNAKTIRVLNTFGTSYSWTGPAPTGSTIILFVQDSVELKQPAHIVSMIEVDGEQVAYRDAMTWGGISYKFK